MDAIFSKSSKGKKTHYFNGLSKEEEWVIYEGLVGGINRGESEDLFEG